jgi:hypothetical protein
MYQAMGHIGIEQTDWEEISQWDVGMKRKPYI